MSLPVSLTRLGLFARTRRQNYPFGGHYRPRPDRHHDGICFEHTAIDLSTSHARSIRSPNDPGDSPVTQFGTVLHGSAWRR